ncbi:MAG: cupin [Hylemonella sp.]|uniref:cupin n=1 Tax=Hylemonella sp. TaxID=2066020 RepID=UPI0022C15DF5|nr:cupin [Hylemonella sp.]MCZ8252257.1 cupin [Hylemonella sp.]
MDRARFEQELQSQGYEMSTVTRTADGRLDVHTHPFEARALILAGEIRIRCEGEEEKLYRPGEVFHLAHGQPHSESYGPEGVSYLVGRR